MTDTDRHRGYVATVGTFDGLHRGHRALLDTVISEARRRGLGAMAVTFDRHPLSVVAPDRLPPMLADVQSREQALRAVPGLDSIHIMTFDEKARAMTGAEFLRGLASLGVLVLVAGHDNVIGSDRLHGEALKESARSAGIEIVNAPAFRVGETTVSSSAVRHAVGDGDVALAARLLGRPYSLEGIVTRGRQIGRTIGFPTANLAYDTALAAPAPGVYAAVASVDGAPAMPAMINIGTCPTVSDAGRISVETNIIGFSGDIYGHRLKVSFLERLRPERRMPSLEALRQQLDEDRRRALPIARKFLDNN